MALADTTHHSPYAGQETRAVASLSNGDIEELTRGGGWGLAKSAELNGLPGPAHLLEMKAEIGLTAEQEREIVVIRDGMRAEAKALGTELIALERALDDGFRGEGYTPDALRAAVDRIAEVRGALRYAHLSAHLRTPAILTAGQVERYNALRGYASGSDPCTNVPKGHNATMWRKHNGCD